MKLFRVTSLLLFTCFCAFAAEVERERNWTLKTPLGRFGIHALSYDPPGDASDLESPEPVRYLQICFGPLGSLCAKLGGNPRQAQWRSPAVALFAAGVIAYVAWTHRGKRVE